MKTTDAVAEVAARLAAAGIEDARREARIILAAALRLDAAGLLMLEDLPQENFEPLVRRRVAREPLAYILGRKEFWGLEFEVSPATLIPRPDSETLIEAALAAFPERRQVKRILDLGTGTGCLLLAALSEFMGASGVGVDISPEAVALATRNAQSLGFFERAAFVVDDWAAGIDEQFDLILSNPPYIAGPDLATLMPEVGQFEPLRALDGGTDGMAAYREIIAVLPRLLAQKGVAVLELGCGQADQVGTLALAAGLGAVVRRDMANIPRALTIRP